MVIKKCKICGEEFEARGSALTCSPECSKINRRNNNRKLQQSDKYKEYHRRYEQSDKCKATRKKYRQSNARKESRKKYKQSDKGKAARKRYKQSEAGKASAKRYRQSDKGKAASLKGNLKYQQKKISELNKKFDGDLNIILERCPTRWHEREAIMQVEFGVSYAEVMYQKINLNPVCEVTGRKDNLVIHHLDSFNTHPELGADLDNLVRVASEIHDEFHSIYGWGDNTREQWFEFLEKNKYNINK